MTDISIINKIENLIREAETMKNAYFFKSPTSAGGRRSYEKYHSISKFKWIDGKDIYSGEFITSCSCNNVYAKGYYTKNGKKTTLTAIKNSLKRLTLAD